ncbi:MAG: hypothetical protein WC521_05100 [Bdellovibrionales bacterium]
MKNSAYGFTLTETAVVLSVASLVLGAIWVAAGTVSNASQTAQSSQQVGEVAQNIRSYYMNAQGIPMTACNADISSTLDSKIFPAQMRKCTTSQASSCKFSSASSSASGSFSVRGHASTCPSTSGDRYRIVLSNLTKSACANLLISGMSYKDSSMGIIKICGSSSTGCSGGTAWSAITCTAGVCTTPTDITLAQAQVLCSGTGATNQVGWEFKLRN